MNQTQNSSYGLSEAQVNRINPYITVSNNQYHFNAQTLNDFNQQELQIIDDSIQQANVNIIQQHLTINVQTKIATSTIQSKAAWNSHYTSANFWWGTRYYFTSNQAVTEMQYQLTNGAIAWGIAGAIGGVLSGGGAAVVAAAPAAWLGKMSNDLGYYNSTHSHNQIYMDVNYAGNYSMHVLA